MVYTLTEAAAAIGKSRQAVQAAIKRGTISARKSELGEWQIDPAELHRVYPPVAASLPQSPTNNLTMDDSLIVRELRERIAELRQERDDWKRQAEAWQEQANRALPAGADQRKPGFLARLFGRA